MNLKGWKRGLLISMLGGLFTGLVGLAMDMGWKQIALFVAIQVAKEAREFMAKHSIDEIADLNDTVTISKSDTPPAK